MTGRAVAGLCGWHYTKVSKLEHGTQSPSEDDIREWCRTCDAGDQIPDLIATVRAIDTMYTEWHRQMRAGLKRSQVSSARLYDKTKLFRSYENTVLPGLFHTAEYAGSILRFWAGFLDLPNDADEALAVRMERQRVLYSGDRRFLFVIEEQALRTRVGSTDIMLGQLDRVLAIMSLPRVSLGIIPAMGERHSLTQGSFWIFDDDRVQVEGVSAGIEITQPREIEVYLRAFGLLQRSAIHGKPARELVNTVINDLAEIWEAPQ